MLVDAQKAASFKIRFTIFLCRIIPLFCRRKIFNGLASLACLVLFKHKLIALHNLTHAFPEKSAKQLYQIMKKSYQNFALLFAEFTETIYLNKDNLHRWVSVQGLEHYEKACREGKGAILISAHFGNWEMGNAALAILSRPVVFMARVLDSPFLEEGSSYIRSRLGTGNLHTEKALRSMLKLLKQGEALKLLIDQNVAVYEGVFVNFFGRPACATPGVALVAMRSGAPVLPIFTTRLPDGKYLTEIGPPVETVRTGNREQDVLTNTQNYASVIEAHIRKYPDQWLWMHQRWKTKPCQAE